MFLTKDYHFHSLTSKDPFVHLLNHINICVAIHNVACNFVSAIFKFLNYRVASEAPYSYPQLISHNRCAISKSNQCGQVEMM